MKTLFIDTHYLDINIVLFENGLVVNKKSVINKKNNSEYIFPTIIKVIDGIKLDNIIVVNGPGSFTGVRLGVTIAKTFAYTLNIPIRTISSLECLAVSGGKKHVAISDGNGYYLGDFKDNYAKIKEYEYVDNDAFNNIKDSYSLDTQLDYEKIFEFVKNYKVNEVSHAVKPIYVKKISVEL